MEQQTRESREVAKLWLAYYYKNRAHELERTYWYNLRTRYGLSREDVQAILQLQGGGCGLCGVTVQANGKRLSVDHCHDSTFVRGILCEECNVLLGRIEKNEGWMLRAIEYLASPPAQQILQAKCVKPIVKGFGEAKTIGALPKHDSHHNERKSRPQIFR